MASHPQESTLQFPAVSFRRIPSPAESQQQRSYVAIVDVFDLPDLADWRRINVRDPKETGSVPRAIRETLLETPSMFQFKNRGLVLTAKKVSFDTESGTLAVTMEDPEIHGLLDGGHSYKVIKTYCSGTDRATLAADRQALVRVELLEGFGADQISEIVEARNTSNQVKDQSLLELENAFEGIKQEIAGTRYANLVAYKEYEIYEGTDGKYPKPIDVREIIALLTVFDKDHFGDSNHPILAYSQKAACLKRFKDFPESYKKIFPLTKDVLALWDEIHLGLPDWYASARQNQGQGARFGRITGVSTKPAKLSFLDNVADYSIPTSFKYPILAAMRSFLEETNGRYIWGKALEPLSALNAGLGEQLAEALTSNALEMRNPTKLGKTNSVWDQCYSKAQIWYLKTGVPVA